MLYSIKCKKCGAEAHNVKGWDDPSVNAAGINDDAVPEWDGCDEDNPTWKLCSHEEYDIIDSEYEDMD